MSGKQICLIADDDGNALTALAARGTKVKIKMVRELSNWKRHT